MAIASSSIDELTREAATTKRVLEREPPKFTQQEAKSTAEIITALDASVANAGDAADRHSAVHHAEPLVSPSWPACADENPFM